MWTIVFQIWISPYLFSKKTQRLQKLSINRKKLTSTIYFQNYFMIGMFAVLIFLDLIKIVVKWGTVRALHLQKVYQNFVPFIGCIKPRDRFHTHLLKSLSIVDSSWYVILSKFLSFCSFEVFSNSKHERLLSFFIWPLSFKKSTSFLIKNLTSTRFL